MIHELVTLIIHKQSFKLEEMCEIYIYHYQHKQLLRNKWHACIHVCVCMHKYVLVRVCMHMRVCMCVCVSVHACVYA